MGFNVMDIGQCLGSSKKCIVCKYLGICRVMVLQNESNIANTSSSEQVETQEDVCRHQLFHMLVVTLNLKRSNIFSLY